MKYTGICKYCGKEFTTIASKKRVEAGIKYCSNPCKYADRKNIGLGGWKHAEETKEKMSKSRKEHLEDNPIPAGEDNPNWKGGKEKYRERRLEYNKEVASQRGECPDCGKKIWNHGGKCSVCAGKDKAGRTMITFQCDYCKEDVERELTEYKRREYHYCSKKCEGLHRRQIMPRGKDHWLYKNGQTPFVNEIRSLPQNREWRKAIFERDGFVCKSCGVEEYINAHHIKLFSKILMENNIQTLDDAISCVELWNINNGVTLCPDCHKEAHSNIRRTA